MEEKKIDDSIILCSIITWLLYYQSKTYVSMHLIHSSSSIDQYLGSSPHSYHHLSYLFAWNFSWRVVCCKALINQTVIKELIRETNWSFRLVLQLPSSLLSSSLVYFNLTFINLFLLLSLSVFVRVHVLLFKFNWINLMKLRAKISFFRPRFQ